MALCGHEGGWPCGRASRDTPRERCLQGDAGEVGPQRRAQHRATDAARLVPAGTLQVDHGTGDPRDADGAQAGAEQAPGPRDSLRGILRGFGLKVGKTTRTNFAGRIEELVKAHPNLQTIGQALLRARAVLLAEFNGFEKRVRAMSRLHEKARLLMSTPAVGPIVSLTFACAIDDPSRFTSSKQVGPHFGLTPKKYQSGETDYTGRISKHGDASVREALYEAAHIMLTKPIKGCSELKSWAMRIARRAGTNKAKVALARKLAVVMLRMLKDNVPFNPAAKAATA